MIIRVQTNIGQWRVEVGDGSSVADIERKIAETRPALNYTNPLSLDPSCTQPLDQHASLSSLGLKHGSMIYCRVDASTAAVVSISSLESAQEGNQGLASAATTAGDPKHMKRVIQPDGSIKLVHDPNSAVGSDNAFRKGMMPLRDMKMSWTLAEFNAMEDQFTFRVAAQTERWVGSEGVSMEQAEADSFQSYLRQFAFQRQRFGFLYGRFVDEEMTEEEKVNMKKREVLFGTELPGTEKEIKPKNKKVVVEAIYEPPQEADPEAAEGFVPLDDPYEEQVDKLAAMLGMKKVGWILGHPPREKGFQLSAAEVIMAAELQIEAADGIEETPFVTVRVTVGDDGNVIMEAFQVSKQCMEMVAEEALLVGENPGFCYVNETFTVIQEGKESKTVDNNFFLTVVPIHMHSSDTFVSQFPKANRDHDSRKQSHDELRKQLSKSGSAGWTFIDLLADFNLLIYLSKYLDIDTDISAICKSIVNRDIPLGEGYKLIIASMAGLDNAY
jgi:nuclear protein localization protein 4 homolog